MAQMQTITVEVILKFDELEKLFQEWLAEQPKDEVIEDALNRFLDWMREAAHSGADTHIRPTPNPPSL